MKRFGTGLAGGVLGGILAFGGAYVITDQNTPDAAPSTTDSAPNTTKVSNITYNVKSDTTKAVEKAQDAVVSVINLQKKQEQVNPFGGLFGTNDSEADTSQDASGELETNSEGSGVIYKKEGGEAFIVTNNHVVSGSDALEVLFNDGTTVEAELVGSDTFTDLAVLKINSEKVTTVAEFGDSDKINVGEPAIAIGSPLGTEYASSVTQGIISAKDRSITSEKDGELISINAIQTDAAINPGNSGGALVNAAGQVIGINSIKIASSNNGVSAEGMGFAIPSNDVVSIINQLEKDGKVIRPALGVSMYDLTTISSDQREKILNLKKDVTKGVVVLEVTPATPAEKAGLEKYDVIVEMDGQPIESSSDLQSVLYKKQVGDKVDLTFYRGSDKKTVEVELTITQSALRTNE
ncbi:S1C family serine protease [Vagococcus elongatus]